MLLLPGVAALVLCACRSEPVQDPGNAAISVARAGTASAETTHDVSGLPLIPLEIHSGGKTHRFTVEIARSADEQAYGLMNRRQLGPSEGMVFPFAPPRAASFWMKDTLIPLDMLFIRADGSVARIATAQPLTLEPVQVAEPVAAVLEIPGGRAATLGIGADARVTWPGGPKL
jgi:uncharacterized membrane protein (UPF0127 family)